MGENLMGDLLTKGESIRENYLPRFELIPNQPVSVYYPIMIPPAPLSRFVDKLDKEGFREMNRLKRTDKKTYEKMKSLRVDARKGYEAEVCVYRAIERLKLTEKVIVLHSLKYKKSDFQHFTGEEEVKCKDGECDILVMGENFFVIIEVKKNAAHKKDAIEEQLVKDKKLTEGIFNKISQTATPCIMCYAACPYEKKGRNPDAACIYKEDLAADNFGQWWETNIQTIIQTNNDQQFHDLYKKTKDVLIALWATHINDKDEDCESFRCSLGWNIMDIDAKLKQGHITFIPRKGLNPETSNPSVKEAPAEIQDHLGVEFLTTEQHDAFEKIKNGKSWLLNGPAGSGKTILLAGRVVQFAKSEPDKKILIISSTQTVQSTSIYQEGCLEAGLNHRVQTFSVGNLLQFEEQILKFKSDNNSGTICLFEGDQDIFGEGYSRNIELMAKHFDLIVIDDGQRLKVHMKRYAHDLVVCGTRVVRTVTVTEETHDDKVDNVQGLWRAAQTADTFNNDSQFPKDKQVLVAMDIMQFFYFQTSSHDSPEEIPSSITLTRNFRNSCDISDIASRMRDEFLGEKLESLGMMTPKQESGHYLRGPIPIFHLFNKFEIRKIQDVLNNELLRIKKGGLMKKEDIAIISFNDNNSYKAADSVLQGLEDKEVTMCPVRECFSLEFPAVIVLLESQCIFELSRFDYEQELSLTYMKTLFNRLYTSLTRARVLCTVLMFPEEHVKDKPHKSYINHLNDFANKFESLARVIRH